MAQGIGGFVKENLKSAGKIGAVFGVAEVAMAENKLKGIASALATILTFKAGMAAMFVGTFSKAKDSMSNLIKESGSLDAALRRIGKAAEDAGTAYAKAKDNMKAGAGAAWAESEITNTKNMTRAVEAMTPAVTAASNQWVKISGGFSTAKSEMIKAAAESGVLGSAINVASQSVGKLAIGASAIAGVGLVKWLFQAGAAAQESAAALSGMSGTALRVVGALARLTGIGVVATAIFAVVGAAWSYVKAWQEAGNASNRMLDAALDSTRAIAAQISMIKTAEDQAKAYASALDELTKAQKQWIAVKSSGKSKDSQEMQAAETAKVMAEKNVKKAAAATPTEGPGSGTEPAVLAARTARAKQDAELEDRISNASEESKPALLREKAERDALRAATGKAEVSDHAPVQMKLDDIKRKEAENSGKEGTVKQREREEKIAELNNQLVQNAEEDGTADKITKWIPGSQTALKTFNATFRFMRERKIRQELTPLMEARDRGEDRYNPETYVDDRIGALKEGSEADKLEARNMEIQKYRRTGEGADGTQEEISFNAARIDELRELANNSTENKLSATASTKEADRADIRATEAKSIADIERDIANAKEKGYDLSVKESEARRAILEAQLKTEVSMGRGKGFAAESIRSQIIKSKKEDALMRKEHAQNVAASDEALKTSEISGEGQREDRQAQQNKLDLLDKQLKTEQDSEHSDPEKVKSLQTQRNLQKKALESMGAAHAVADAQSDADDDKSNIEGVGYAAKKKEFKADIAAADSEGINAASTEQRIAARTKARNLRKEEAEFDVAGYQKGRGIRSELERSSAMVRGDSASIKKLNNFDEFKGNFDRLRADLGTDKAAEVAGKLSRDAITLRARNDMNSSNAGVASASMARIGGGGGIGPGATSMIDISKQIKDLNQEGVVLLKEIRDLEKGKLGIPAR